MLAYIESADYAGYDPYDAMNGSLLGRACSSSKAMRIAATQLLRRCPVNLRPVLGIHPGHNAKAIGLFLWGYSRLYALERDRRYLESINYLIDLLRRLRSAGCSGHGWGYNFDWQSSTFLRPKGTPTIVNTSFIGHALLDCHELTGEPRALETAIPIKEFILNDLHRTRLDGTFCFSYTPVDTETVHNANLLGALTEPDGDNNVESVRLENAPAGNYLVQISAVNLLGGPQDFALVVTGDLTSGLTPF